VQKEQSVVVPVREREVERAARDLARIGGVLNRISSGKV
jgi:hypothetical protein